MPPQITTKKQSDYFQNIKEKVKNNVPLTDHDQKFIDDFELQDSLEVIKNQDTSKPCQICGNEGRFLFRRITNKIIFIRGIEIEIKNTSFSFACPSCFGNGKFSETYPKWHEKAGQFKSIPIVKISLLNSPDWEFIEFGTQSKHTLEKFLFTE